MGMFNFTSAGAKAVYIDPTMGTVLSGPPSGGTTGGGTGGTGGAASTAAVASPKNAVVTQNQVQLNGSGSTSADGKPLTYAWTVTAGSPSASISGANTANPLVQLSGGIGIYSFTLTVTDDTGKTATDTATVNFQ
jgi:hypothetical protein